jgi:cob(I)alamin adenosyltransferase
MRAYGRHVFICIHGDCAGPEEGLRLRQRFLELNRVYGLNKLSNPARVKCSIADCLGVCSGGPIMVVYPDGIWYHHVDLERLDRIYQEHILGGRPVEAYIFHRLYPAGQEPAYAPPIKKAKAKTRFQPVKAILPFRSRLKPRPLFPRRAGRLKLRLKQPRSKKAGAEARL